MSNNKRKQSVKLASTPSQEPASIAIDGIPTHPPTTPSTPTLLFKPPQDMAKMLYMVKVVGGFLNLYIHRKTLSSLENPALEPYGLANLMMFHPEQIWSSVASYISDEHGVYLEAYKIDDLPVEIIFKAIFIFAQGIVQLDIVNMWSFYCKGFDEDMALHIMEDISKLSSMEKLMQDDPSKGLAHFLGEVLQQTAKRGVQ